MNYKFYGIGGQGIKTLASTLGEILCSVGGGFLTVTADYDTIVRGTNMQASLIISDKKINAPEVANADFCVIFSPQDSMVNADVYIADEKFKEKLEAQGMPTAGKTRYFELERLAKDLGGPIFQNMLTLGVMLKANQIELSSLDLKAFLPERNVDGNVKAVQVGYDLMS